MECNQFPKVMALRKYCGTDRRLLAKILSMRMPVFFHLNDHDGISKQNHEIEEILCMNSIKLYTLYQLKHVRLTCEILRNTCEN